MQIAVLKEATPGGESRVALVPESAKKLKAFGLEIAIESGAGIQADADDASYEAAGGRIRETGRRF